MLRICGVLVLEKDGFFVVEANAPTPELLKAGARTIRNTPTNAVVERFKSEGRVALNLVTESTIKVTGEIATGCEVMDAGPPLCLSQQI
jgi:hypothetical protein